MNEGSVFTALTSLISLCGLAYLYLRVFPAFAVDEFRQRMFQVRDRLFDEADAGLIPFDHPAYGLLRATMNGYIRFGYKMNLFLVLSGLIFSSILSPRMKRELVFDSRWNEVTKDLPESTKARLNSYRNEMHAYAILYTFLATPGIYGFVIIAWVIFELVSSALFTISAISKLGSFNRMRVLDDTAFRLGES